MKQGDQTEFDFSIERLGLAQIPSPMKLEHPPGDGEKILYSSSLREVEECLQEGREPPQLERGGPREKLYFDPQELKCGIVTCGGLCPGLNDVIRAIVMSCFHHYGVRTVYGFRFGFEGLIPECGHAPLELTPELVCTLHTQGGSILGSSRGPQDVSRMVQNLERMGIGALFVIGGDGTLRGALAIAEEIKKRGLKIAVVGVPKTIDNDISFVQQSFGFETAIAEARHAIASANIEANGYRNGLGLVKLMGRDSGFVACFATLASNDVNFCLIPEVPFNLQKLLSAIEERIRLRRHAVVVVAEGAGQELFKEIGEKDASGNVKYGDIGLLLRESMKTHFEKRGIELNLKYIDPSYMIRSQPANAHDAVFCLLLGQNAVHAAMSGRTGLVVTNWRREFAHVPLRMVVGQRRKVDPAGIVWRSVLSSTGQPATLV